MSEKQLYWIGKGNFGVGKNAIKYGKPMPKIDPKRLKSLIKEGSVGELKTPVAANTDEVIADLKEQLKEAKSGDESEQSKALQETLKTVNDKFEKLESEIPKAFQEALEKIEKLEKEVIETAEISTGVLKELEKDASETAEKTEGILKEANAKLEALQSDLDTANKFLEQLGKGVLNPKMTIENIKTEVEKYNKVLEDKKAAEDKKS